MWRSGSAASLSRASLRYASSTTSRIPSKLARGSTLQKQAPRFLASGSQDRPPLALVPHKSFSTSIQRYSTNPGNPLDKIDKKHEEEVEREKLEVHPDEVSATSSVHEVFHEKGVPDEEKDIDMLAGIKSDLVRAFSSPNLPHALITGATENHKGNLCFRRGP